MREKIDNIDIAHKPGMGDRKAYFHLPGLFEFYELYRRFLPLFYEHREYFYDWCEIGSIYGNPPDCLWAGGRMEYGEEDMDRVLDLISRYNVSGRLTFSNLLLREEHLGDSRCNAICTRFSAYTGRSGVIVASDLLKGYLADKYKELYLVSSTTKVITDFDQFVDELNDEMYRYVVPDFRMNKRLDRLSLLSDDQKEKVEFLINECCDYGCKDRKACYEAVSLKNLGKEHEHVCTAPHAKEGYRFSLAMKNPGFISLEDIENIYLPMGFSNFKIEGRGLGSALVLEFMLYYMTKPEYQLVVREELYLDNMLDLF